MTTLTAKQTKAASMIGGGSTKKEAAEAVGVTPQTISDWMHKPEFVAAINTSKEQILEEAQDAYRGLAFEAVSTLSELMKNSNNDAIRLRAAAKVIDDNKLIWPSLGGWDVGPTTAEQVMAEQKKAENPELAALLGDLYQF